jgi:hypothetical protein
MSKRRERKKKGVGRSAILVFPFDVDNSNKKNCVQQHQLDEYIRGKERRTSEIDHQYKLE